MKVLEKDLTINKPGYVKLIPEETDDLWLIYNLIAAGDTISKSTSRKIHLPSVSSFIKQNPYTVKAEPHIKITAADYENNSTAIRVRGRNLVPTDNVKAGVFHTIEIERNKEYNLTKKNWNEDAINSLIEASDRTAGTDLAVILMNEGLVQIFTVGKNVTTLFSKTGGNSNSIKFFETLFSAFVKHIDLDMVRCVAIGSPGSLKDEFRQFLLSESHKLKIKSIENNKSRIVLVNTRSANKSSLKEVLKDNKVMNMIKDTKSAIEIRLYKEFTDLLSKNSDLVCYGLKSVEMAQEFMAIETLMITDDLIRSSEILTREKYTGLVKLVKGAGGNAVVFSTTNVSGEELAKLTGIAAILRFALPDIDEIDL